MGLPGRILHGLWTMAQVARAQTEAAGGPHALRRLAVQFRGMGFPRPSSTVTGAVREVRDGVAVIDARAVQNGNAIIRNAEAEVRVAYDPRVITPRQELILRKVVEAYDATGQPVGSKTLAADPELEFGPSTIRNELAILEEQGLLAHPHTSAGRVPTDAGHRYYVDNLLSRAAGRARARMDLQLVRREVDEAMRVTSETL